MSRVPVSTLDDDALGTALRALSLTLQLTEARRVAELLGRDPTETELTLFDTMWSEHCSYKSSRNVLKKHLPTDAGNVILGPGEDAGIFRLAEIDGVSWSVAVAHESHNHPSQVMPVEGAATGIGGVVRDVYCMGADVIATLDPLRFGNPQGANAERSREITREVMEGIAMYGNALGVPNLGGDVVFDDCFDDNCLVNVVAVGLVREDRIVRSRVPNAARNEPYDFILVGKPTDWSGMGGAAFASADLDHAAALENRGSVQVADPFLKRMLVVANQAMLDMVAELGVEIGFKDLGAGGIACVSSEMADAGGFGIEIDLALASLAEEDLPSRVAACSETQERFGLAVPARLTEQVLDLYNEQFELPAMYEGAGAARLGHILVPDSPDTAMYRLRRGDEMLVEAPLKTITEGVLYDRPAKARSIDRSKNDLPLNDRSVGDDLRALMASPHLCSRRALYQHYDCEVKAQTVLRPGEADAGVVAPVPGSAVGLAMTCDGNPRISRVDPYLGGLYAVVESVRNVVAVGAVPSAVTDCLNYGNPEVPEVFHDFREGVRGIGDACRGIGRLEAPDEALPVISGNVSFYNQSSTGRAISPSPIVACLGTISDVSRCRSLAFKQAGSWIVRVGAFSPQLGGSVLAQYVDPKWVGSVAAPDFNAIRGELRVVLESFLHGWITAAHDVSDGGTSSALVDMALGAESRGRLGFSVDLTPWVEESNAHAAMFAEAGGFLLEVDPVHGEDVLNAAKRHGAFAQRIGEVTEDSTAIFTGLDAAGADLRVPLEELAAAREGTMPRLLSREEGEG